MLLSALHASPLQLKEILRQAEPGSYLVTQQGKFASLLYIKSTSSSSLVLEEITIPCSSFAHYQLSWKAWLQQGAPGHTSWTTSLMNLHTGLFEQTYSYTHHSWMDLSQTSSFLSTLMNLTFEEAPLAERKKVGLPPGHNKPDHRPLWYPRAIVDGHPVSSVPFKVYRAHWPRDQSDLSSRAIDIYLPAETTECLTFFPYWVEVEGRIGNAKLRVIDSGRHAHSPREMPCFQ